MQSRFGLLLSCALLSACASNDPRYRDTSALEKPPTLVIERQETDSVAPETAEEEKLPEDAVSSAKEDQEDEAPKTKKGLGDQVVSISATPPLVLTIRQTYDEAWNSMKKALIQSRSSIEVTDLEHDKGRFYVTYDADSFVSEHGSFIERSIGLFNDEYVKQGYLLTVSAEGSTTQVTAAPAKDSEFQKRTDRDDEEPKTNDEAAAAEKPTDGADKLLRALYLTLKDELLEN